MVPSSVSRSSLGFFEFRENALNFFRRGHCLPAVEHAPIETSMKTLWSVSVFGLLNER